MTTGQRRNSMRERFREQVREDVKTLALGQLSEGGAQSISLKAIAKEIGVSAPALYRYYANRDELLNTLVIEAYYELRDTLADDAAGSPAGGLEERIQLLAVSYRRWANAHPHRYELLFKPPFPGYDAHAQPISEAASTLMDVVHGVLTGTRPAGAEERDPATQELAVRMWTRMHGFVTLELGGAYNATGIDADVLFDAEVRAFAVPAHLRFGGNPRV